MLSQSLQQNYQQEYEFGIILANLKFSPLKFRYSQRLSDLGSEITNVGNPKPKFTLLRKETPTNRCTKEDLKEFLNSQPRPNWKNRIEMFYKYDSGLVINWVAFYEKNKSKKTIIFNKKLFELFIELTRGIKKEKNKAMFIGLCRNSQRGLVKMMEKEGFKNNSNYLRTQLVFVRNY
ncbi:hypothetical protein M0813_06104 [Anaeramoeba flamelloides]|uniref:Homing endonuclease LAGLIDADG domain-containing protein n=1 Tax=Anaeramoeba flamelloides TaxID=1746091 RepID=A0ABQ8XF75_9EUKA|nr:hypothetical protein M0813_06104 [Anaeramoeba flamelloides]